MDQSTKLTKYPDQAFGNPLMRRFFNIYLRKKVYQQRGMLHRIGEAPANLQMTGIYQSETGKTRIQKQGYG